MTRAQIAGLALLMGLSMTAQAQHTFAGDDPPTASRTTTRSGTFAVQDVHRSGQDDMSNGCHHTSPIPEPGTYAMLLAGLGLIAGIARRRRMDA